MSADYNMRRLIAIQFGKRFESGIGVNQRERNWMTVHKSNPKLFQKFCQIIIDELLPVGLTNFSSGLVVQHMRWLTTTKQIDGELYRVNDHWGYDMGRLFCYKYMDLFPNPPIRFKLLQGEAEALIRVPGIDADIHERLTKAIEKGRQARAGKAK